MAWHRSFSVEGSCEVDVTLDDIADHLTRHPEAIPELNELLAKKGCTGAIASEAAELARQKAADQQAERDAIACGLIVLPKAGG